MNKKLLALLATVLISPVASAATVTINQGQITQITGDDGSGGGDCSELSETVNITLSAGVRGSIECNTTDHVVAIATCHTSGRQRFNAQLTDATTGQVTPTDVTQGVIFTSSSLGGKLGIVQDSGCTSDPSDAATTAGTPSTGGDTSTN